MEQKIATIFGGSGFLGRYVVQRLAREGYRVNVASRNPSRNLQLKTNGPTGQIAFTPCDIRDEKSVARALRGSDIVVNLVGILHEGGKQRFGAVQAQGAEHIARAAAKERVKKLLHVSALGVDKAQSSYYARSKLAGEEAVLAAFPGAIILRPGLMFGAEDAFFNRFACLFRFMPYVPLIGGGSKRMQPVYVADVADAVVAALHLPHTEGHIFELGGAKVYTLRELFEFILKTTGRHRPFITIPYTIASFKAAFLQLLPNPLLTRDQVRLLKVDNVVGQGAFTFRQLGITPKALENIVPHYLERFRKK